jgi:hypothetical protein
MKPPEGYEALLEDPFKNYSFVNKKLSVFPGS